MPLFGEHVLAGRAQGSGGGSWVGEGYLQHGPRCSQRGSELMGCVGDEVLLPFEGRLQPGEQAVDGIGEIG